MKIEKIIKEGRRKYKGRVDVFGRSTLRGSRKNKPTKLMPWTRTTKEKPHGGRSFRTLQRSKKRKEHKGQTEFEDPKPYGKEGRSVLDHKTYSRIYNLLTEVGKPELSQVTAPKSWNPERHLGGQARKIHKTRPADPSKLGIKPPGSEKGIAKKLMGKKGLEREKIQRSEGSPHGRSWGRDKPVERGPLKKKPLGFVTKPKFKA